MRARLEGWTTINRATTFARPSFETGAAPPPQDEGRRVTASAPALVTQILCSPAQPACTVRSSLGAFPVQRLNACVNALTS